MCRLFPGAGWHACSHARTSSVSISMYSFIIIFPSYCKRGAASAAVSLPGSAVANRDRFPPLQLHQIAKCPNELEIFFQMNALRAEGRPRHVWRPAQPTRKTSPRNYKLQRKRRAALCLFICQFIPLMRNESWLKLRISPLRTQMPEALARVRPQTWDYMGSTAAAAEKLSKSP